MSNSEDDLVTESSEEAGKPQESHNSEDDLITEESIKEADGESNSDNKSNKDDRCSSEESELEESDSENDIDEDTAKINSLTERVYKYDNMSDGDKLKNIKEYQNIASTIKDYDIIVAGYKKRLEEVEKMIVKSKKTVSSKTYTNTLIRFREIKDMISDDNSYSVLELLNILQELKGIKQAIGTYLNKQLEVINL